MNSFFWLTVVLIVWNMFTMLMMGIDKQKARKHKFRIPESTLFLLSFLGGGLGILVGMLLFRHKTKHLSFRILVPLSLFVNAAEFFLLAWAMMNLFAW